jgi:hypothetical protein
MEYDIYGDQPFKDNLGQFLYACDDFELGTYKHPFADAIGKRYLDPNTKNKVWAMVFDIDRPQASMAWDDAMLPEPNWVCQNPKNSHAHIGYALTVPVTRSINSLRKPQALLARIEHSMSTALGADPAYGHRLTKNPIHPTWRTFYGRHDAYDFDELRGYLPDNLPLIKNRGEAIGEGRNVLLFTDLRNWAYRARLRFPSLDAWLRGCFEKAQAMNSQFHAPLPLSEVKATAKSVATWTWDHMSPEKFAAIQARRSSRASILRQSIQMDFAAKLLEVII